MPPIPPPDRSGMTTSTEVPLYWVAYHAPGGAPVLLLHGGPGASHDYLLPQMLRVGRGTVPRPLVLYDQRGGGRSRSDDDRSVVTWRTQVDDLAAVVRELGLASPPPTIVGYSWGGLLAMLYAIEAAAGGDGAGPAPVPAPARLVLIDPAPVRHDWRRQFEAELARRQAGADVQALRAELAASGLRERDPAQYRQRAFELSVAGYFADPRRARDLTPFRVTGRVQQSVWKSLGDFDLLAPGRLDAVHCPALVVHGRQDPIPLASSEACARALHARLVVLEDCGHVPYVEQPDALFAAVDAFLSQDG